MMLRALAVRENPAAFSKYTVEFVKVLERDWPPLVDELQEGEVPW